MSLFKGKNGSGQAAADGNEPDTAQFKAIDLSDAFHEADRAGLLRLDTAGRAKQMQARWALFEYADQLWDHAKAEAQAKHGEDYAVADDPVYSGVAGMKDLAETLLGAVQTVQAEAGESSEI